ncbi:MAG: ABC transporter ATP-binding protein [Polyangiales bacterium]
MSGPAAAPAPKVAPGRAWAVLRELIAQRRGDFLTGALFLVASSVTAGLVPQCIRAASNGLRDGHADRAAKAALAIVGLALVGAWTRVESRVRIFNGGREVEFTLRERLLASLHRLGPAFYRTMPPGEIMSRATNDLGQVRLLVGFGALNLVNTALAYAVNIPLMFWRAPTLAALALLPFPFFVLLTQGFSKGFFQRSRAAQEALGAMSDRAQRSLAGMRVVRAYGLEAFEARAFRDDSLRSLDANLALARLRGLMFPILGLGAAVASLVVVWYGSGLAVEHPDKMTVGDILAFQAHLALVAWPTIALGYMLSILQRGRASTERVIEVIDATPDIADRDGAAPLAEPVRGELSITGLTYAFEGRNVLDEVRFAVPAGGRVAIVGRTGSGKSVLAKLLARMLPTPAGAVSLDGRDVTDVPLRDLRRAVGLAQQEPFLFSTTIARNIAFAEPDPDAPEAVERARHAAAEAQILAEAEAMPDGLDTIVGERGVQLSGGQKQRVALARALLAKPRVLILDDPLSAVDARTEAGILDAIERAAAGRTLLLITHRVAAASRCDRVVVLDAGRVVEEGTHAELVTRGGLYARLAERQALEAELEAL